MTTIKKSIRKLNAKIITTCIIGFALSYYAYYVELAKEENDLYEAVCDINEHISCTKAFSSKYGKGFGIISETSLLYAPNSIYGLMFYLLVAILSISNKYVTSALVVILEICANLGTLYLAYILYKLSNICVVCVSLYLVNVVLLTLAVKKQRKLYRNSGTNKKKGSK
ncbi:vitamin-K epoxide reductase [Bombus vancouverensis nearcticus]|uniref:vitamin-K epoxide reductase n=1 Tax=Bombus vancouverensis nearcticus TaxID=2705178 RepID=UPI001439D2D9|nr:vitamin K epoxide reductase complex subunit 1-like protein 1 [Bombus vancouverensis nearcticus]